MISFQQAWQQQDDLELLCKPMFSKNVEYYGPNNNYGFASILKQYARYPKEEPLMALIPHGVYLNETEIFHGELSCALPKVLNYPAFRQAAWKKQAKKKTIIATASPFLYALKLYRKAVMATEDTQHVFLGKNPMPFFANEKAKGYLFFHAHSTAVMDVRFNQTLLIDKLNALQSDANPITICLHWHDVLMGTHHFFNEHGFKVVSAGHLYDDDFIFRWLHLVSQFKQTLSNSIGSSLFYSVAAGVPHQLLDSQVRRSMNAVYKQSQESESHSPQKSTAVISKSIIKRDHERYQKLLALFSQPTEKITEEQKTLVAYFLGQAFLTSPAKLNKQLKA